MGDIRVDNATREYMLELARRKIERLEADYDQLRLELRAEVGRRQEASGQIIQLEKDNAELWAALEEIAKAEGAFSIDPLTFANNIIDNMQKIAMNAIAEAKSAGIG